MARLFVAVWPPPPVVDAIAALPREPVDGVRYTTRDQWHATLRFLGECAEDEAEAALAAARLPRVTVTVGPAVERLRPDVVVLPVAGLDPVAAAVRAATAEIGEPIDPQPFAGHLTVARQRRGDGCSLDGAALTATFAVAEVALVRSTLHADGARYENVAVVAARA